MNISQKIARTFEIVDYFMLIPAACATFLSLMFIGVAPWFPFLIFAIFIFGCVLMIGYFKHSRGRLNEKHISALWIATIAFNAVLSLPFIIYAWYSFRWLNAEFAGYEEMLTGLIINLCFVVGYLSAIILAFKACKFDKNQELP